VFRRRRFGDVVARQLAFFEQEDGDLLDDVDKALDTYNRADRDEAEELYGDYVDAVETGTELLADIRDYYAATLDDPARYLKEFNRAVERRWPELAVEIENR
jgi:hypothetical protein